MLRHLAADERAARLLASLADAGDDLGDRLGLELADGHVVEEEQRLGAGCEDVVGAHGHQVDAHRVVLSEHLGDLELGAHAVGAAHEQRVGHVLRRRDGEQAAESADVADDLGTVRLVHDALMASTARAPSAVSTPAWAYVTWFSIVFLSSNPFEFETDENYRPLGQLAIAARAGSAKTSVTRPAGSGRRRGGLALRPPPSALDVDGARRARPTPLRRPLPHARVDRGGVFEFTVAPDPDAPTSW